MAIDERDGTQVEMIVVHDPRRMIAEGLAAALTIEPEMSVVAVTRRTVDLSDLPPGTTVVATSDPDAVPPGCCTTIRICGFSIDDPVTRIVSAIRSPRSVPTQRDSVTPVDVRELSERELEIVRRLADGLLPSQIGVALGITPKSVDNHKQRIFAKLGVQTQAHAIVRSRALGLLRPTAGSLTREALW